MKSTGLHIPSLGMGCVFQLVKFKADGTMTYVGPKFHNILLESGFDLMLNYGPHGQDNGGLNWCNLGTGAQFEKVTDEGLQDYLVSSSNVIETETYYSSGVDADYPAWRSWRQVFEFAIGSIGRVISEIGLSRAENTDYFNRHRIVDYRGYHIGLDVLPDEGLKVWTESFLFGRKDVADEVTGSFLFQSTSGPITIGYTWKQLDGWLTKSGIVPGALPATDIRMLSTISSVINSSDGTPATSTTSSCAAGTGNNYVTAKWSAGTLSGEYVGLMVNISGSTYGRFEFDTPIVMDDENVALELTVLRNLNESSEESDWI